MLEKQTLSPKKPGHGHKGVVDVVLGAQWGDEGKGKLVRTYVRTKCWTQMARFRRYSCSSRCRHPNAVQLKSIAAVSGFKVF